MINLHLRFDATIRIDADCYKVFLIITYIFQLKQFKDYESDRIF